VDENPESGEVRVWVDDGTTIAELFVNQPAFAHDYDVPMSQEEVLKLNGAAS
jgi:hypothetical protein